MVTLGGRVVAALLDVLPPRRRDLGRGLLAEASEVPRGRVRRVWLAGGLRFLVRESALRLLGYALALSAAVTALLWVDWNGGSDDAGQVALLVLLISAALMGFASPRWAWLAGMVLGVAIAVADLAYIALGVVRTHPTEPAGIGGAASLLVLILPAMIAAYLGAGIARLTRHRR